MSCENGRRKEGIVFETVGSRRGSEIWDLSIWGS